MAARSASSLSRVSAWALAFLMVAAYEVGALGLLLFRVELPLVAPWWAPVAVAPILYTAVVTAIIPRFRLARVAVAVLAACLVNLLLAAFTAGMITMVEPSPYVTTFVLTLSDLPAAGWLRTIWAPLVLLPFRDLLATRSRYVTRGRSTSPRGTTPEPAAPAPPTRPAPVAAPPASAPPAPMPEPAPRLDPPSPAGEAARRPAPMVAPKTAPPVIPAASVNPADLVRIPFERVADQFPPGAFSVAPADLGARLRTPGHFLIPRSIVLPQLLEGAVRVSWDVVAPQIPADVLALTAEEIGRRLAAGLNLPLDEIVRQLPADLFALAGPSVDVRSLEDFPMPFQPHTAPAEPAAPPAEPAPVPSAAGSASAASDDARPAVQEAGASRGSAEAAAFLADLKFEEPDERLLARDGDEADPLAEALVAAAEPAPPAAPRYREVADVRASEPLPIEVIPRAPVVPPQIAPRPPEPPRGNGGARPAPASVPAEPPPAPRGVASSPARSFVDGDRMAAELAPHFVRVSNRLEVEAFQDGDTTLFVVAPPSASRPAVAALAARVSRMLVDERFPGDVTQATLRGERGALVLTPLGASIAEAPILVAIGPRDGSLALLESQSRRAAAPYRTSPPSCATRSGSGSVSGATTFAPGVSGLAESLTAFGSLSAARRQVNGLLLHVALPAGMDAAPVADLAADIYDAAAQDDTSAIGGFQSLAVECGPQCVVIREIEAVPGRATVLVAGGGPVQNPGLARLQIERAAVQLGAGRA
jgi:predicted regulator of Ras-like GTPase activity (Roadblock/LC7/MglB family)